MLQKGFVYLFLVILIALLGIGVFAYKSGKIKLPKENEFPLTNKISETTHTPTTKVVPTTVTTSLNNIFSFNIPDTWTSYEYPNYKEHGEFPDKGVVAILNSDKKCNFYIGLDSFGREGPSEIYDNKDILIDGIKFNKRSWYFDKNGKPFTSYYSTSDDKLSNITIYSWTPDQNCIDDVEQILKTLEFK